jgi:glycosyltransferase involved in cell wall biosynthesis
MTLPLVSVLIPAYHERFFDEALASARCQSYAPLEIVVCDDSPGTRIGVIASATGDSRVRYVRNATRLGFDGNFTECLHQARGELIKYLNDDDRLRPGCVAVLAGAFSEFAGVTLAATRRSVIDENGAAVADRQATQPISVATCRIEGRELGNLVLVNSLNLIGEPSAAMFRRSDLVLEDDHVFRWGGRDYHCLADMGLWLRLLAKGAAYYHAAPLCEYRVHAGQEQRGAAMDVACISERLHMARQARRSGFLPELAQYRMALARISSLAVYWLKRTDLEAAHRRSVDALRLEVEQEVLEAA